MRTSFAASALLTACIAASGLFGVAPAAPVTAAAHASAACREAAWPYVPAECIAQAGVRPVRLLRADAGR